MVIRVTKPSINVREKLAELDRPTGAAGAAMLRAETPQEQFNLINAGRRNLIINGAMDIWQRGDTFPSLGSIDTFSADRMHTVAYNLNFANATGGQIDRSYIYGTHLDGVNFSHALKISPSSTWKLCYLDQRVEDVTKFSDVPVTVSYYARANAAVALSVTPRINQMFGSGGSATVATYADNADIQNLTTDWQRFSYTMHCPSISGKTVGSGHYADFYIYQATDLSAAGWIEITGFQVEYGKIATPFEHRPLGEELALCQRYYWKYYADSTSDGVYAIGQAYSTSEAMCAVALPTSMRTAPAVGWTGSSRVRNSTGSSQPVSNLSVQGWSRDAQGTSIVQLKATTSTTNLTAGHAAQFRVSLNDYIEFKAEL